MDPFRKYIITQIIKQSGKIPRATSLIDNAVAQLKIRIKNMGVDISKVTDPKEITKYFNMEKSWFNQQIQQKAKNLGLFDPNKNIFMKKGPFEGFKPKVVPKPKDIKSKLDKQNKESIQRFKDKMKKDPPEDLAGGGIAGMLGERTGYQRGGPPGGGDPGMTYTAPTGKWITKKQYPPSLRHPILREEARKKREEAAFEAMWRGAPPSMKDREKMFRKARTARLLEEERIKNFEKKIRERKKLYPYADMTEAEFAKLHPKVYDYMKQDPNWNWEEFQKVSFANPGETFQATGARDIGLPLGRTDTRDIDLFMTPFGETNLEMTTAGPKYGYKKIMSDQDKAQVALHEMRHKKILTEPLLTEAQPPLAAEVSKLKQSGRSYPGSHMEMPLVYRHANPPGSKKEFSSPLDMHEVFTRFMDRQYGSLKTPSGPYFDKIWRDEWQPYADKYEKILKEYDLSPVNLAGGGLAPLLGEPTYQDEDHRVPLSWGGWLMRLLQKSPSKLESLKDFTSKREFILSLIGQGSKQRNKRMLAQIKEEMEKIRKNPPFKFADTDEIKKEVWKELTKGITKHADGGRVPLKGGSKKGKIKKFLKDSADSYRLFEIAPLLSSPELIDLIKSLPFEKGGRVGLWQGGLAAALRFLMQKYGKDVVKLAKDVKPSKKWDTQKAVQGFLERNPQFKNKITAHSGDVAKAGEGRFTKAEVLLEMFKNTIKQSKSAKDKKMFTNFSKEIQNNPELAKDSKVWNFFTKGLPKDQKLTVYADDTVDFWRQSKFGPHNIKTTDKFMKKHPYLTRDQAVKIQNMEPENQIFELRKIQALNKRTMNAEGGIVSLNSGGPLNTQALIQLYMAEGMTEEEATAAANKPLPFHILTDKAEGGRVPMWMGGGLGVGKALLREMLKYFSKGSTHGKSPLEMLKMLNPKQFQKYLDDLRIYQVSKKGISAPKMVKEYIQKTKKERADTVEEIIASAKNIKKADDNIIAYKKQMIDDMAKKGVDKNIAETFAEGMSKSLIKSVGPKNVPKVTEKGLLELQNIHKNLVTKGRPLNASGGLARMLGE